MYCLFFYSIAAHAQKAVLKGNIAHSPKDTMMVALLTDQVIGDMQTYQVILRQGKFRLELPLNTSCYFAVSDNQHYIHGLMEPGDSLELFYDAQDIPGTLRFAGSGAEKCNYYQSFAQLKSNLRERAEWTDSLTDLHLAQLRMIRSAMRPESYNQLRGQLEGFRLSFKYNDPAMPLPSFHDSLSYSFNYINAAYNILSQRYASEENLITKYKQLSLVLPAALRVPVLTMFLSNDVKKYKSSDMDAVIESVYGASGHDVYKRYIRKKLFAARTFRKGIPAPDFALENERGEVVGLADFRGKVVYIDFWFEACVPCQALLSRIQPLKERFNNVVFLYVSVDDRNVWKRALVKVPGYHLYTNNKGRQHPVLSAYNVNGYPTTYIIGKDGHIFNEAPSGYPNELAKQLEGALGE